MEETSAGGKRWDRPPVIETVVGKAVTVVPAAPVMMVTAPPAGSKPIVVVMVVMPAIPHAASPAVPVFDAVGKTVVPTAELADLIAPVVSNVRDLVASDVYPAGAIVDDSVVTEIDFSNVDQVVVSTGAKRLSGTIPAFGTIASAQPRPVTVRTADATESRLVAPGREVRQGRRPQRLIHPQEITQISGKWSRDPRTVWPAELGKLGPTVGPAGPVGKLESGTIASGRRRRPISANSRVARPGRRSLDCGPSSRTRRGSRNHRRGRGRAWSQGRPRDAGPVVRRQR